MAAMAESNQTTDDTDSTAMTAAVFLDKGGTGKTTTTAHLGRALTELGLDGVLIDLAGKQSDLSKQFGIYEQVQTDIANDDDLPNIASIFDDVFDKVVQIHNEDVAVNNMTYDSGEGVDIIPAHPGLDAIEAQLATEENREKRYGILNEFVDRHLVPRYDFVLIDLPGLSGAIPYNGIWAAENIVAPVENGDYEFKQAQVLASDVEKFRKNWNVDTNLTMVIPNKNNRGTNLSGEYADRYEEAFGQLVSPTPVAESQDIRNATEDGHTIFEMENPSTTAQRARESYLEIGADLVARLDGPTGDIRSVEEVVEDV